jgi:hypothetical protein
VELGHVLHLQELAHVADFWSTVTSRVGQETPDLLLHEAQSGQAAHRVKNRSTKHRPNLWHLSIWKTFNRTLEITV